MLARLGALLRANARVLLLQTVGLLGLCWCLGATQAGVAALLTLLLLADQAIALRHRAGPQASDEPLRRWLDGWCLAVAGLDVLLCCAALLRSAGLRDGPGGPDATSPLDSLAYVLATVVHGATSLEPVSAAGRLLGAVLATGGAVAALAVLVAALRGRRHG